MTTGSAAATGSWPEPNIREGARAGRAFLGRAVRYLAAEGIRQFLDIGSGTPTERNVHEVAQEAAPGGRPTVARATEKVYNRRFSSAVRVRSRPEILRFVDFDLVDPGLVYIPEWLPDSPADVPDDPGKLWALVGIGRKP